MQRAQKSSFLTIKYANFCLSRGHCVSSLSRRECARTCGLYSAQFEHTLVGFVKGLSAATGLPLDVKAGVSASYNLRHYWFTVLTDFGFF